MNKRAFNLHFLGSRLSAESLRPVQRSPHRSNRRENDWAQVSKHSDVEEALMFCFPKPAILLFIMMRSIHNFLGYLLSVLDRLTWTAAVIAVVLSGPTCLIFKAQAPPSNLTSSAELKFSAISAHRFGDAPFEILASSISTGTITYSVLSGPAVLSGPNTLTLTGGGTVQLSARQAPNDNYKSETAQTSFPVSTATSRSMTFARIGPAVKSGFTSDTPNYPFIDSDGKFFFQNADSQYDTVPGNHVWNFYHGANAKHVALSKKNSQFDTQAMCEQGNPIYKSLYAIEGVVPGDKGYTDGNFCDVIGVWVDPDTGDWYGVVHNELYPNIPRIDVISYALSTNHGATWVLQPPIVTSPYGLGNKKEFYYYYGEGDPRLVVDTSSGYFYLFYNSRIMIPHGSGFSSHEWEHVSRAPISKKMAPDSWEKYYNGTWSQSPGIDWTCDATRPHSCATGTVATSKVSSIGADNDPTGQQIFVQPASKQSAGDLGHYTNSVLRNASVSWNVYLGKYIAFAEDKNISSKTGDYDDPADSMKFYVSGDLAKQEWTYAGEVPYRSASWYRWLLDSGNFTSTKTIGSTFLAYCTVGCSEPKNDSEYIKLSVRLNKNAPPPTYYSTADGRTSVSADYSISHPDRTVPPSDASEIWTFVAVPEDDGFFFIKKGYKYLGVAHGDKGRAWGAPVRLSMPRSSKSAASMQSRQQWYFERILGTAQLSTSEPRYRLINRYSGLALSFTGSVLTSDLSKAVTAPIRNWDALRQERASGIRVWQASDQELVFNAPLR